MEPSSESAAVAHARVAGQTVRVVGASTSSFGSDVAVETTGVQTAGVTRLAQDAQRRLRDCFDTGDASGASVDG